MESNFSTHFLWPHTLKLRKHGVTSLLSIVLFFCLFFFWQATRSGGVITPVALEPPLPLLPLVDAAVREVDIKGVFSYSSSEWVNACHFAAFEKGTKKYWSSKWFRLDETFAFGLIEQPTSHWKLWCVARKYLGLCGEIFSFPPFPMFVPNKWPPRKKACVLTVFVWSMLHFFSYKAAIAMLASGKVNAKPMISHRFRLEEVHKAFQLVKSQAEGVMKVIVDCTPTQPKWKHNILFISNNQSVAFYFGKKTTFAVSRHTCVLSKKQHTVKKISSGNTRSTQSKP